jgi:hypothetical protein
MFQLDSDRPLRSGEKIALQSQWSRYLSPAATPTAELSAGALTPVHFTIENTSGGEAIEHLDQVALKAPNDRYVTAERDGLRPITANRTRRGTWETFTIHVWDVTLVRLRSHNDDFVVAEGGGGREVRANRPRPLTWETFALYYPAGPAGLVSGTEVFVRAWDGHFLCAEGGGGDRLVANRTRAAEWETFTLETLSGRREIASGDTVTLRAKRGKYWSAVGGGGGEVWVNREHRREWEQFRLDFATEQPIPFSAAPSLAETSQQPYPALRRPETIRRRLVALLVYYADMPQPPDLTVTPELVRNWLMDSPTSMRRLSDGSAVYGISR